MKWQPIETAPMDGTIILLTDGFFVHLCWKDKDSETYPWILVDDYSPKSMEGDELLNYIELNGAKYDWPTHWMPLPEPPNE